VFVCFFVSKISWKQLWLSRNLPQLYESSYGKLFSLSPHCILFKNEQGRECKSVDLDPGEAKRRNLPEKIAFHMRLIVCYFSRFSMKFLRFNFNSFFKLLCAYSENRILR